MKDYNFGLIMAGGQGTRFWPWSSERKPKQFLNIVGKDSLIAQTFNRLKKFIPVQNIFIVADKTYLPLVKESISGFSLKNFIEEPCPRNTAACLVLSNIALSALNPAGNVLVVPADHYIPDEDIFARQMTDALEFAPKGKIITAGIKPHLPHTGYGYINFDREKGLYQANTRLYVVSEFKEKPDLETARTYVGKGNYFWNSGMFVYNLASFKDTLSRYAPYYYDQYCVLEASFGDRKILKRVFSDIKPLSIDYALMEKAENVVMFAAEFRWSDVGSWLSMYELNPKDKNQNVASKWDDIFINTRESMIFSTEHKPIAVIGVNNIVVVNTKNGVLISSFEDLQRVKEVFERLQSK